MKNTKANKLLLIILVTISVSGTAIWASIKHFSSPNVSAERYIFIECPASYAIISNGQKTYVHKYYISNIFKQPNHLFSGIVKERDNAEFQLRAKIQAIVPNLSNEYWTVSQPSVNEYSTYEEASKVLNIRLKEVQSWAGTSLETFIYNEK